MSVFPNELLSLFIHGCSCWQWSPRSLFVTTGSGTWLVIIQPYAHVCQFHGFNFVQLTYAYKSFYILTFTLQNFFLCTLLYLVLIPPFIMLSSIASEWLLEKPSKAEKVWKWNPETTQLWTHWKDFFFPHLNVKRLTILGEFW